MIHVTDLSFIMLYFVIVIYSQKESIMLASWPTAGVVDDKIVESADYLTEAAHEFRLRKKAVLNPGKKQVIKSMLSTDVYIAGRPAVCMTTVSFFIKKTVFSLWVFFFLSLLQAIFLDPFYMSTSIDFQSFLLLLGGKTE